MTRTAVDAARSFFAAYDAHDVNKMVAALSEDARFRYVPMGKEGEGKAREMGKAFWSGLIDAFPDLYVRLDSVFGDEHHAAAEVMIGGTQRKDFLGIPNQGKHYDLPHCFLLATNDRDLVTGITCYWDNVTFYSQLGKPVLQ
jgi:steroid delta-isomerase-like uncharacterized protein